MKFITLRYFCRKRINTPTRSHSRTLHAIHQVIWTTESRYFLTVISKVLRSNYFWLIFQFLLPTWFPFFNQSLLKALFELFRLCSVWWMCFLFFIIVSRFDFHLVGGLSNARRRVSHAVVSARVKLYSFIFGARALPRNILKTTINHISFLRKPTLQFMRSLTSLSC